MGFYHALVVTGIQINNVGRHRSLRRTHTILGGKGFHILLFKSQGGKKTEIIHLTFLQICVRRSHHYIPGHLEAGKKSHSQGNDSQNRKISAKALFDLTQGRPAHHRPHNSDITSMRLLAGSFRFVSRANSICRGYHKLRACHPPCVTNCHITTLYLPHSQCFHSEPCF